MSRWDRLRACVGAVAGHAAQRSRRSERPSAAGEVAAGWKAQRRLTGASGGRRPRQGETEGREKRKKITHDGEDGKGVADLTSDSHINAWRSPRAARDDFRDLALRFARLVGCSAPC